MRRSGYAAVGIAVLAIGAAGCGGDDNNDNESASTPASTPAASTPATSTPAAGGAQTIPVGATEFKFDPSTLKAKSGEVTFDLKNDGAAPHALEIEGKGVEEETKTINGGQSATLKVNLKPGKYEFYCPVDGHRQQGMEGTLTVT
jgi:plastocyanin